MYFRREELFKTLEFQNNRWEYCSFLLFGASDEILLNVVYRSLESGKDTNDLLQLMQEIGDAKAKYKVVIDDFNLPNIKWEIIPQEVDLKNLVLFILRKSDCVSMQIIQEANRVRGANAATTLDLLLTNGDGILDDVNVECRIGKSGHACNCNLQIQTALYQCPFESEDHDSKKQLPMYERADYEMMKCKLDIDWRTFLGRPTNTKENGEYFNTW